MGTIKAIKMMRGVTALLTAALAAAVGCGRSSDHVDDGPFPVAREPLSHPSAAPRTAVRPLRPAPDAPPIAPATTPGLAAAPASLPVDARVLIITADGTDAALDAIDSTLSYLGTPHDILNATRDPALTATTLADGDHGKYQAVFLDLGDLSVNGVSAFTTDEWNTLAAYEARFGVRQVSLYTSPSAAYGLSGGASIDPEKTPIQTTCSAAGTAVLAGVNCAVPVVIDEGWAYPASIVDGQTTALLSDGSGNVYAAIHTTADGREQLALTFAQASYQLISLQLGYGLVSWATRGVFIGERHVYLSPQIDDLFLASTIYPETGTTYRINDSDMQALADWQSARRANPLTAGLRLAWACNMMGARDGDALTAKAMALGPTFAWISHTWDHADLTNMSYPDAYAEFSQNDQALRGRGLTPYMTANLVTPGITGLDNPNALLAAYDVGVRQVVSDTSVQGEDNPSPNAGFFNAHVPGILEIPRIPTNLDYDVSMPSEWLAAWTGRRTANLTYSQILTFESRALTSYLLQGNNDPLMFHQANTRNIGFGRSLLSDLLGATLDRYLAMATFPVLSPTMDELAARVMDRMTFNASGVAATILPSGQITVSVANAARVPITGLCTPTVENYGGQQISYLAMAAGASTTLSLTDCNPGGTTGTGGAGGGGGAGGAGGGAGSGGGGGGDMTGGMGVGGAGGNSGQAGTDGGGGASGMGTGGTTGAAGAGNMGTAGISGGAGTSGAAGDTGTGGAGTGGAGTGGVTGTGGGAGNTGTGGAGTTGAAGTTGGAGTTGTGAAGTSGGAGTGGGGAAGGQGGATGEGGSNTGGGGSLGGNDASGAAGATGGGAGAGGAPSAGCDCAVTDGPPAPGLMLATFAGAVVLSRARRRRRR